MQDLNTLATLGGGLANVFLLMLLFAYAIRALDKAFEASDYIGWSREKLQRSFLALSMLAVICWIVALLTLDVRYAFPYSENLEQATHATNVWRKFYWVGLIASLVAIPLFIVTFFRKNVKRLVTADI